MTFDCNTINRIITFAQILDPDSKLGTFEKLDTYYEKPFFEYQHILRFMDVLERNYDGYLEHLFHNSNNIVKRNTSVCYFDCTNYYFELEQEDDEYVDEATGEVLKGLRKYGPSKDHKPNPLINTKREVSPTYTGLLLSTFNLKCRKQDFIAICCNCQIILPNIFQISL